ncbi:MAG: hypothetical protein MI922_16335 [Bacteroidales bacterium]|nr:hypothetical protein [Bacteroidales bacterium]
MKRNLLLAFGINAVLLLITVSIFTPLFETNDDTLMMIMSSGLTTGEPSEFIILFHYTVAILFKILFSTNIEINWYTLYQYLVMFLASGTLSYYLLKYIQPLKKGLIAIFILYITFFFFFFFLPQFTATGFIIIIVGFVFLFDLIYNTNSRKKAIVKFALLLLYAIIGTTIRDSTLQGVLLLSFPFFLMVFIKKRNLYIPAYYILVFILYLLVHKSQLNYYENHGHKDTFEYLGAQGDLMNFPIEPSQEALDKVGWSKNDVGLLYQWFFVDSAKYSTHNMRTFADLTLTKKSLKGTLHTMIRKLHLAKRNLVLAIVILIILFTYGTIRLRFQIVVLIGSYLGVLFFLAQTMHLPPRVLIPLFFLVTMFAIFYTLHNTAVFKINHDNKIISYVLLGFIVGAFTYQMYGNVQIVRDNKRVQQFYYEYTTELQPYKDNIIVIPGGNFPYEGIPIFKYPNNLNWGNIIYTGWLIQMPAYFSTLKNFGIENLIEALYLHDNLLLTHPCDPYLQRFILENYKKEVKIYQINETFNRLKLYKVIVDGSN